MFLGQSNEVGSVRLLRVGIVDYYTFTLLYLILSDSVTLLLGLQCISVHSGIVCFEIVIPKGRFSSARGSAEDDHLFLDWLHTISLFIDKDRPCCWNWATVIAPLELQINFLLSQETDFRRFEWHPHILGEQQVSIREIFDRFLSPSSITAKERVCEVYLNTPIILLQHVPHLDWWLPIFIISTGNESVDLDANICAKVFYLRFNRRSWCFA